MVVGFQAIYRAQHSQSNATELAADEARDPWTPSDPLAERLQAIRLIFVAHGQDEFPLMKPSEELIQALHAGYPVPAMDQITVLGPYNVKHSFTTHIAHEVGGPEHDGRHIGMQAKVIQKLLHEDGSDRKSLWALLLRIIRALEVGMKEGRTHFYIQIHCRQGRRRSVASCLTFAKMLEARLLGIYTEVHMTTYCDGETKMRHHGRFSHAQF